MIIAAVLSPAAFAASSVTDGNGNTYASVSAAVNAASEGEELVLTLSGDLTENIYVNKNIDLTINAPGCRYAPRKRLTREPLSRDAICIGPVVY